MCVHPSIKHRPLSAWGPKLGPGRPQDTTALVLIGREGPAAGEAA